MPRLFLILLALAVAVGGGPVDCAAAGAQFVTIGTGGVTGVYYPAGAAICRQINKTRRDHGIRCTVERTDGSVYNLRSVSNGELEMGIAQSDWQYHAYNGTSKFESLGPLTELRSVFSLHPEPFTVVARRDSGVSNLEDIKGKRINIGNPGSGQRGTMEVVMAALGWTLDDFALVAELAADEQSKALCSDQFDVMIFTVGHPSGSVKEASTSCDSVLVNIAGPVIDKIVAENDYYRYATIPGGMYRGTTSDIKTFGVGATVVTSVKVPEEVVYNVVKAVFENFDEFRKLHPAFDDLKKSEMVRDGLSAPLHPGALKYYKEVGLL